jgi:methylated-DNA-[protein]-cysteine S-methyltransferase
MNSLKINTPVGNLQLLAEAGYLVRIAFPGEHLTGTQKDQSDPLLTACAIQLSEYFDGKRQTFDMPLEPTGTEFQQDVWCALKRIPFGKLRSYGEIAREIGRPSAVRAVGAANGRNPLPIIVPCHRVIGSDGSLTGFAGGLAMKKQLLTLEGALLPTA